MKRENWPIRLAYPLGQLQIGGAELQSLALADQLIKDGFSVDYISRSGPGPLDARAREIGAGVRYLGRGATASTSQLVRAARIANRAMLWVKTVRAGHYDIVDSWMHPADTMAALTRPLTGTPVVMSARLGRLPRTRLGLATGLLEATVSRLTDAVVANADIVAADARIIEGVPAKKVHVIRGGVELPPDYSDEQRAESRAALGASTGDLLIGCVGNFRPMKRQDLLIEAFSRLVARHPKIRLVLVGDGELRPGIEAQVTELGLHGRILVHGHASDTRPLYNAFDLFVQASNSEGLPNVILEAAAARLPIVATAAGGTGEVVHDGETGLLVPIDDVDSLTRAIDQALSDAEMRLRLGSAARQVIEDEYGMERFIREYVKLYRTLLAAKKLPVG